MAMKAAMQKEAQRKAAKDKKCAHAATAKAKR